MEKYLINPLWIYLIDLFSKLNGLSFATIIIGACAVCVMLIIYGVATLEGEGEEVEGLKPYMKKCVIAVIVATIGFVSIPSEKTMYTMFVTSYITEENLNSAKETVTDVVDYIFEKVDELQGE